VNIGRTAKHVLAGRLSAAAAVLRHTIQVRRFSTLDGLRGYAAFLVYLNHSAAWYVFARTGIWAVPATRLFAHFGRSSVEIFFMITGFLFWVEADRRGVAAD
jgi:peptidoglycan/LPS O-acetylase OafA/YrhL